MRSGLLLVLALLGGLVACGDVAAADQEDASVDAMVDATIETADARGLPDAHMDDASASQLWDEGRWDQATWAN